MHYGNSHVIKALLNAMYCGDSHTIKAFVNVMHCGDIHVKNVAGWHALRG
jgi:hypothetical protein